ncbi:hypothetical protein MHU86_21540 [Fragilaria crotonensis]|nr:hypothetical protein MHU86_21540 [Fragilaria crotonensis]
MAQKRHIAPDPRPPCRLASKTTSTINSMLNQRMAHMLYSRMSHITSIRPYNKSSFTHSSLMLFSATTQEIQNTTPQTASQMKMTPTDSLPTGVDTNPDESQIRPPEDGIIVVDRTSTSSSEVALNINATSTTRTTASGVGAGEIIEANSPLVEIPFDFATTSARHEQEDALLSWNVEPFVMDMSDQTVQESLNTIRQVDHILNTIMISYSRSESAATRHDEQSDITESDVHGKYCFLKQ